MRRLLVAAALACTVAACNKPQSREQLASALAEQQKISAEKDSLLAEMLATTRLVNDINGELTRARIGVSPTSGGAEGTPAVAEDRTAILGRVREALARLEQSEKQLEASKARVASLGKRERGLLAQIDEYRKTVADLRGQLERQQQEYVAIIDQQKLEIQTLGARVDTVTRERDEERVAKRAVVDSMNTVYIIAGTKDELLEQGVVTKEGSKFLFFGGRTIQPARTTPTDLFTKLDRTRDTVIVLPDSTSRWKIVSRQNPAHLGNDVDEKNRVTGDLHIAVPSQFWASSRYLILMKD